MKICFDNVNFASTSGPNSFGFRLANAFLDMGHDVTDKSRSYDIFLTFIESTYLPRKTAKRVLRLDGIWFKKDGFASNNAIIRKCYEEYEHVIMQSEFDKQMCFRHFGERENVHVIHNGIKIEKFPPIDKLKIKDVYNFICSASWHGQKRLEDNIKLFQKIRKQISDSQNKESRLIIIGGGDASQTIAKMQLENLSNLHNVGYYGHIKENKYCLQAYASSDAMIHLAWNDHCPNVVVEALSQNCPIICTNSGGTQEIVGNNGIIIPETTPYNYELVDDFDKPYNINLPENINIDKLLSTNVDNSHLDIENIAKKYIEIFEK